MKTYTEMTPVEILRDRAEILRCSADSQIRDARELHGRALAIFAETSAKYEKAAELEDAASDLEAINNV